MSYCRWSSDNWRSDIYAYEDASGSYTTHVASNRVAEPIPVEPSYNEEINAAWMARHKAVMDYLASAERHPIGLPHDGATFSDPDLETFLETLETLRGEGYRVPESALEDVRLEIEASRESPGS